MTYYAKVIDGEIVKLNCVLPFSEPQVSFSPNASPDDLKEHGYFPIVGSEPAYDPATERLAGPAYDFDGEQVNRVYTVTTIPQAELDAKFNSGIKDQIARIEAGQARAVREAALGDTTYLEEIEAQIQALRAQLK